MNLTLGNGAVYEDPDSSTIRAIIEGLADENEDEAFAILDHDEMTYIQTAIEEDDSGDGYGFVLEYQAGATDEHYACDDGLLTEDAVVKAFTRYAQGDARWRSDHTWVKIDVESDTEDDDDDGEEEADSEIV